jgi:hypothetical protein
MSPLHEVVGILAGAFLSGAGSLSIGILLFLRIKIQLDRAEFLSLAFLTGAACLSQIIFVLSSAHLARKSVFIAIGLVAVAGAVRLYRRIPSAVLASPIPSPWRWLFAALFTPFGVVYLVNAMAPEASPDGAAYHLPFVDRYLHAHGFERIAGTFYSNLSQGIELLFLPAVSLGGHSSAATLHFLFLLSLPLLMFCYGRRFGFPIPAVAAAFLVFAAPVVGWDGTSAYVDVAAAAVLFGLFYLLQVWDASREPNLLIPIGILAGFSYAAKFTAAIAIPYTFAFVIWKLYRSRSAWLRPTLIIAVVATIVVLPWMCKNVVQTGNPFAPFANHIFPNQYVHVSFEHGYRTYLRHYHLAHWLSAPWELAVKGERLQGFFGPVFLLMPLALLSLRDSTGRRLLLAGTVFALPWFLNIGSRFLIPAMPLLALALATALATRRPPWLLPSIMILHAVLSWYVPPIRYFDRYAPRIAALPLRAAFRIEAEQAYLARTQPGYRIDRLIERQVSPGNRVFSFEQIPQAWTNREIVTGPNAAGNELLSDFLQTALASDGCPVDALDFRFAPAFFRRVRAVQGARVPGTMWSISEFQVLQAGNRLPPDGKWRMTANPNPWDASLAFDDSLVTRWRSWEDAAPGMFLEVDFGEPKELDEIRLVGDPGTLQNSIRLLGMDAAGGWHEVRATPLIVPADAAGNRRAEAIRHLQARGIDYLLITPAAFGANDFNEKAAVWGLRASGESEGARLYRLDPNHAVVESAAPVTLPMEAVVPVGVYDDADPRIQLREPWTHDPQFQEAYGHTLSYSDLPGASVSLPFRGRAVTYIYTRARNRGIAEVWIDGELKSRVDLYAPTTAWQSSLKYEGVGEGEHKIRIRVTGQRNPLSTGSFVDLDALIVE